MNSMRARLLVVMSVAAAMLGAANAAWAVGGVHSSPLVFGQNSRGDFKLETFDTAMAPGFPSMNISGNGYAATITAVTGT